MATFKVLLVLAMAVSAYAVPMPRPSVVEATVQEITEAEPGKFPQGPAEPHQPEEEVPAVIPVVTVEEVAAAAEESKAAVEEAVEAAVEAAEEAVEAAEEAAEKAAEEEAKAEAEEEEEEEEEAVQEEEEGSGLLADESDEASGDDVVELDAAADSAFAAQLQFDEAAFEASGVAADDAEGSGFNVAGFARSAALLTPIEASGEVAEDEAEVVDGSGDETLFDGAASDRLRLVLEGSGEVAADEAEQVEGSGRRIRVDAAASEPLVLEASGDVAFDEAEGSGAQEPELGIEGEDLLTSK